MGLRLAMGCALLVMTCGVTFAQQGFQVIVHEANPTTLLNTDELSDLFLKKKARWKNGNTVDPVDQAVGSEVRAKFSDAVHRRSTASVKSFWQRQIFSGSGTPPVELENDSAVIAYVRDHPNAVGYVSNQASLSGVKSLLMLVLPVKIRGPQPQYTRSARLAGIRGQVILEVTVDTQGSVSQVSVVEGLRMGLTEAAESAVKRWKFQPGTVNGVPTEAQVRLVIEFAG